MKATAMLVLFWGGYAAWNGLFAWIAWRGMLRPLLVLGAPMLLGCAAIWVRIEKAMAAPTYNHSGDMGHGMAMLAASAVLLVPVAVAAIVFPIGRLWVRQGQHLPVPLISRRTAMVTAGHPRRSPRLSTP